MTTEVLTAAIRVLIIVIACIGLGVALYIIHGCLIGLRDVKRLRQAIAEWQQTGGDR